MIKVLHTLFSFSILVASSAHAQGGRSSTEHCTSSMNVCVAQCRQSANIAVRRDPGRYDPSAFDRCISPCEKRAESCIVDVVTRDIASFERSVDALTSNMPEQDKMTMRVSCRKSQRYLDEDKEARDRSNSVVQRIDARYSATAIYYECVKSSVR
jgi:hypothetical protein